VVYCVGRRWTWSACKRWTGSRLLRPQGVLSTAGVSAYCAENLCRSVDATLNTPGHPLMTAASSGGPNGLCAEGARSKRSSVMDFACIAVPAA
jgi:hypothetical protein